MPPDSRLFDIHEGAPWDDIDMHGEDRVIKRNARLMRGQDVSPKHPLEFQGVKR